jgi:hypothetical protein
MSKKAGKIDKNRDFSSQIHKEIKKLQKKFNIDNKKLVKIILNEEINKEIIPICIFNDKNLSSFETIVKYLRENCNLNFREIGEILNRSKFTIASSYRTSKSKLTKKLKIKNSRFDIPTKIIANRKLSVLESIVTYLKKNFRLKFSEIAIILNLNQRTIWTVHDRAKKKLKNEE